MARKTGGFGGVWTQQKLKSLEKYLGPTPPLWQSSRSDLPISTPLPEPDILNPRVIKTRFPELFEAETQEYLDGSARIALKIEPRFHKYIFIEQNPRRAAKLRNIRNDFPDKAKDIEIVNADANAYLADRCENHSWKGHRAVLFLDPFGMEVDWATIESIANTKAIDLWVLFPLGVGVIRLLRKDARIDETARAKLTRFFGTEEWFELFYRKENLPLLNGAETVLKKEIDLEGITKFFVKRLKSIFPHVLDPPLELKNSKNNPIYLLAFAAGNEKGGAIAVKIAKHIVSN